MTAGAVEQQLHELSAAVADARAALADGTAVDFAGLDTAVTEICAAAQGAARSDRPGIVAAMSTLIEELDRLAADLSQQNAVLHRKRAAEAYGGEPTPRAPQEEKSDDDE